ncbi:hypothetical protein N0A02_33000 (plasmid) [Paraburkholderia acidicola]|uniref:Swt1-like HEPN domain-containing protein n=1 Tax=Paraburkholderia acidicola TaxID=1912599 RepID=A0ABV1LYJ8_9BURK
MSTDEMRNLVRHRLETLERWLRRLIDDTLNAHYDGSLAKLPIKNEIVKAAVERRLKEPDRYPREVDALLFSDLVTILCHPQLFASRFQDALKGAFPDGTAEARTFLDRIAEARNPLSHANDITSHQALRVACYSGDVIDSLKAHYASINMAQTYNAPSFIRVWDDRGNSAQIEKTEGCHFDFKGTQLRPGDSLQLEVQPDESFPADSYKVEWTVSNVNPPVVCLGKSFFVTIENRHVSQTGLAIMAKIISTRDWHRHGEHDAIFWVWYSALPPV